MYSLQVTVPGEPPRVIWVEKPVTTVGRSSFNDVALADKSLSRQHARIVREGDRVVLEDLGSRNGTYVNGERVASPRPLREGDQITLGVCTLTVSRRSTTHIRIDPAARFDPGDATVFRAEAAQLRTSSSITDPRLPSRQLARLVESLKVVAEMTLELLRDVSTEEMLATLMERVFQTLKPDRGVILLRRDGELEPAVARTSEGETSEEIRLSQTLVSTVIEKREGILVLDAEDGGAFSQAESIRISGIKSVMAAPLENDGEVVGLIYVDSRIGARAFGEEDLRLLSSLANVAAAKIQTTRLAREAADKRRMDRDFALAREIQQKLLPESAPEVPGYDLYGTNLPSREVSGDYFDFLASPAGFYSVIADVCGKGVGPALLMAWLEATFSACVQAGAPLAPLVTRLSESLAARTTAGRFITAIFTRLDPPTGKVEFVNAGHNPPLWLRADGTAEALPVHGRPLALFPAPYGSGELTLAWGDLLFLYTDGVTEASNASEEEFGMERLVEFLRESRQLPLEEIDRRLARRLEEFCGGLSFADDRTIVMIRRRPAAG